MAIKDILSSLNPFDSISNLFNTGYSVYQDQRNYNYTKNLQEELFKRDDTAMQRRMADYEKAGINPLFALGASGAGVSSAGSASGSPISVNTSFVSDSMKKKLEREAIKDEIDKRQIEKEIMRLQIKSGKIANLQALQDLNTKQLEYRILQNQLNSYDEFGYYPSSGFGKILGDVGQILNNNLPFNPFQPGKSLFNLYLKPLIKDPSWIEKLRVESDDKVGNEINSIKPYKSKGIKHPLAGELYKVQQDFRRMNNTKYDLHFIPDSKFSRRGILKLYNKRTNKYETPEFVNLDGVIRFLNYGSVRY